MFGFSGKAQCSHPPSRRGQWYTVEFRISLFPPRVSVTVTDPQMPIHHRLGNSRFNFQSRDDYIDLLALQKWRSVWYDRYAGIPTLDFPSLGRIPNRLGVRIVASWEEPFVVVEFKLDDDFCQILHSTPFRIAWLEEDSY